MAELWFYATSQGETKGPVARDVLVELGRAGLINSDTLVWKEGMSGWVRAEVVEGLWLAPPPLPEQSPLEGSRRPSWIARLARLPSPSGVPMRAILTGGLIGTESDSSERLFATGTRDTTPSIADVPAPWPVPQVFWRLFLGAVIVYGILLLLFSLFSGTQKLVFVPGMMMVGAFLVPLSIAILLFELNLPRNVPIYQVLRMVFFGGALGLLLTILLRFFIPTSTGTKDIERALGIGLVEETGKALALVAIVRVRRFKWELNGLLFGAAVGAGFAGFETAGIAFAAFLEDIKDLLINSAGQITVRDAPKQLLQIYIRAARDSTDLLTLRSLFSPGGHVVWTAMIGAAIWRVKDDNPFEWRMLRKGLVLRRWSVAVMLHALWNTPFTSVSPLQLLQYLGLLIVGWYFVFASLKEGGMEVAEARLKAIAAQTQGSPILTAPETATGLHPPHIPQPPDVRH